MHRVCIFSMGLSAQSNAMQIYTDYMCAPRACVCADLDIWTCSGSVSAKTDPSVHVNLIRIRNKTNELKSSLSLPFLM